MNGDVRSAIAQLQVFSEKNIELKSIEFDRMPSKAVISEINVCGFLPGTVQFAQITLAQLDTHRVLKIAHNSNITFASIV